eukprot:9499645-Pyramimonas_sp.AAC.1
MLDDSVLGRIAAARFASGTFDILAVSIYIPPRGGLAKSRGQHCHTVDLIIDTLREIIPQVGARCIPLLGGDVND